jgi:DNA-binding SARP family transcriptional activator
VEKVQADAGAGNAKVVGGSEPFKWPLRERLLASLLRVVMEDSTLSSDEIKGLLWADSGLRATISENLNNPLIRHKKILASIPKQSKATVREFLEEFLVTGGNMPC